jgi:FMN-dependent NADH-azoreductase
MKNLLQINASLFADGGQSSQLANQFVAAWRINNPSAKVTQHNLASEPVPHLTAEGFQAFLSKPEARTTAQQAVVDYSDALINELRAADVIVLGLPMYNFGVPSMLKAYIDHIGRAGVTFKYTEKGPVGLLTGKKAYVFAARGGVYLGTPKDTQTAYIRDFLGFIGITDVEFVYAEGLNMGDAPKQASLAKAQNEVRQLTKAQTLAA